MAAQPLVSKWKTFYYRKLYFTTENISLLQKILLHEKYCFYKTCVN